MTKVGVVVVTYRSASTIEACLDSLQDASNQSLQIVVVDNASEDDGADRAERRGATVLRRTDNAGYARANNEGIAALDDVDVVVFANPDTAWPSGAIDALVAILEGDRSIGLVSPVLVDHRGLPQPMVERDLHLGRVVRGMTRIGPPVRPRTPEFVDGPLAEVDWLHTAAAVVPMATVSALGGFDERFFLFAEDADFCRRVRANGQRVVVSARVRVHHIGGASFDATYDRDGAAALRTRALATYLDKHDGPLARRLFGALGTVVYGAGRHRGQAREAWKAARR